MYAGSDTLATARILAAAVRKLQPNLVCCGRQSIDGDTAQVGPEIAALCGMPVRTGVMQAQPDGENIRYATARTASGTLPLPAVLTFEKGAAAAVPKHSVTHRYGGTVEQWRIRTWIPAQCGWA